MLSRLLGVGIVSALAVGAAATARADGLTYLPDAPAQANGSAGSGGGVSGAAVTVDGEFSIAVQGESTTTWTLTPTVLELDFTQRTTTDILPQIFAQGTFVFRAETTQSYEITGGLTYAATASGGLGTGDLYVRLYDATTQTYLFQNTAAQLAATPGLSFEIGDPASFFLEGSPTGRLVAGHVYHLQYDVITTNFNNGGPAIASDAVIRLEVEPLSGEELAELAQELAEALDGVPLALVDAPNSKAAAGRLGSLVTRAENAAEAIADGRGSSARAHLTAIRERIDGEPTPGDWLDPSTTQAALLAQVDALLDLLE